MTHLGKLTTIMSGIDELRWPRLTTKSTRVCLQNIIKRMAGIDRAITPTIYGEHKPFADRPPTGDDYNLLWDAIINEISALMTRCRTCEGTGIDSKNGRQDTCMDCNGSGGV